MVYWYVLFVRTGQEYRVEQFLRKYLDKDTFLPFVPLQESLFKKAGKIKKEYSPLFPGYVFVESELSNQEFIERINAFIYTSQDIVCLLRYSEAQFSMKESERQMLLSLCNDCHCVELSSGFIEGDKIYITDGPLKGRESIVRKINRHKRQVWIEMEFMGELKRVRIALELVASKNTAVI